jgi:hypothetical protein
MLLKSPCYRIQNIVELFEHFDVPEAQKLNTERFDEFLTIQVSHRRSALKMTVPIDFDR